MLLFKNYALLNLIAGAAFTGLVASSGCANNKRDEPKPEPVVDCVPGTNGFASKIKPIINAKCSTPGCHISGGTGNGWFDTYENLKEKVDDGSFNDRVFVKKDMPPIGHPPLTEDELKSLKCWVNNGALNN